MQQPTERPLVAGILLAAGAGRRFGGPKALASSPGVGSWLKRGVRLLLDAGCSPVVVVLGAEAEKASVLLPKDDTRVVPVVAGDWVEGIGASLGAALDHLREVPGPVATLVTLVDLPHLAPAAMPRVLEAGVVPSTLRRATYSGKPGHPVLIGRDHWAAVRAGLQGDVGAGPYLREHGAEAVDCTGLGGNEDIDALVPNDTPVPHDAQGREL